MDRHGLGGRRQAADPVEFRGVEIDALDAHGLVGGQAILHEGDHAAVFRRHIRQIIGHEQPRGADHVLRHGLWLAGNVLADMARHKPHLQIIFAAGAHAHHDDEIAPAVEVLDVISPGRQGRQHERERKGEHGSCHGDQSC